MVKGMGKYIDVIFAMIDTAAMIIEMYAFNFERWQQRTYLQVCLGRLQWRILSSYLESAFFFLPSSLC